MFKVIWNKSNNLVKLVDSVQDDRLEIVPPRIVFAKELRLLGIDKYGFSNRDDSPVCWAINRKYFYKGNVIFEAKGGDIYHPPIIVYPEDYKYIFLETIDKHQLKKINSKQLKNLINEALDFINEQYSLYNGRVDIFSTAFSGGKDSQVVLDLVTKVIPPNKFKAFYTNTGMELPCTFDTVEKTKHILKSRYPDFDLVFCNSEEDVIQQWKKYGPPSRMNRWCCKVRKTSLFARTLKDVLNTKTQPRSVVFEGVRADESAKRETYERVGIGVKHVNLINCRPIFYWNDTEVYLYMLLFSKVPINEGYKSGLTRIGCNICPFASSWSEYFINLLYPEISRPFVRIIEKMAENVGIKGKNGINNYISTGNWKKNAGGKGLDEDNTRMDVIKKEPDYECIIRNPKQDWKIWINTFGDLSISKMPDDTYFGSIKFQEDIAKISAIESENKLIIKMHGTTGKVYLTSYMNKVLMKTAYCERCGVCEAECPTGALVVRKNELSIDTTKCIHCHKCYDVNSYGCIVGSRRRVSEGGIKMIKYLRSSGVDKYSTFGIKKEWFESLMDMGDEWFYSYPGLGPKMIPAAINWFRDAKIVDLREKKLSTIGKIIQSIYRKNTFLAWQLLWINVAFGSAVVNCYLQDLINNCEYSKNDIIAMLQYRYPGLSEATLGNPVGALFNMFDNSPMGCKLENIDYENYSIKMGVVFKNGKDRKIKKVGAANISSWAICYLLYMVAEKENRYSFTVSELYSNKELMGPATVFNLQLDNFHIILRSLTESGLLVAELLGGLDNIKLHDNIKTDDLLKIICNKI